ncbi:MAG: hypothetical protein Q8P86_03120 [bacterium]|nr:hypothetical protein [bacterium]
MNGVFNKTFFKFLVGFMAMLGLAVVVFVAVGFYEIERKRGESVKEIAG